MITFIISISANCRRERDREKKREIKTEYNKNIIKKRRDR